MELDYLELDNFHKFRPLHHHRHRQQQELVNLLSLL
jgi:hypothetical protein